MTTSCADNTTFKLRESQERVLERLKEFTSTKSSQRIFILRGYAGTGKTTLMRFLIMHLNQQHIEFSLMASTGRAAKVLSDAVLSDRLKSDSDNADTARTIHSFLYKYSGFNREPSENELETCSPNGQLCLTFTPVQISESDKMHVYIIDEASMVCDKADGNSSQAIFGSGRLLSDLLAFDTNAVTCHKAQGGEWERVFLSLPRNIMLNPTQQIYRWLYTAFTRAKKEVHLVNDFYIK